MSHAPLDGDADTDFGVAVLLLRPKERGADRVSGVGKVHDVQAGLHGDVSDVPRDVQAPRLPVGEMVEPDAYRSGGNGHIDGMEPGGRATLRRHVGERTSGDDVQRVSIGAETPDLLRTC